MSACEKCWRDACLISARTGQHVADVYRRLIDERKDTPCTPVPQREQP